MREIRGPRTSKLRANRRPLKQAPCPTSAVHLYLYSDPQNKNTRTHTHTHMKTHTHTDKTIKHSRAVAFWVIHESHLLRHQNHSLSSLPFPILFCLILQFNFEILFCRIVSLLLPSPFVIDWLNGEIHHHGNDCMLVAGRWPSAVSFATFQQSSFLSRPSFFFQSFSVPSCGCQDFPLFFSIHF